MSFSDWQPIRCAVCDEVSEHMTLASTAPAGPPALDTRPAETMRSSLQFWILECPNCRYAAPSIATAAAGAAELWRSGKRHGQSFMETREQEFALAADLLRRRGDIEEAKETCLAGLNEQELTPLIEDVLRFQLTLIGRRDTAAHTMEELPKRPRGAERVTLE